MGAMDDYPMVDDFYDDEGDYDWSVFGVFVQRATGRLFTATDAGCSCYGPWEELTVADLEPAADMAEVTQRGREWASDTTGIAEWLHDLPTKIG